MNISIQVEVSCPVCGRDTSYVTTSTGVFLRCRNNCWNGPEKPTISDAIYFGRLDAARRAGSESVMNPSRVYSAEDLNDLVETV